MTTKSAASTSAKAVLRARNAVDDVLREFAFMVDMPRLGACYDEAVEKRARKFGAHTSEFLVSYLRLVATRVKYLAERAAQRDIRPGRWK